MRKEGKNDGITRNHPFASGLRLIPRVESTSPFIQNSLTEGGALVHTLRNNRRKRFRSSTCSTHVQYRVVCSVNVDHLLALARHLASAHASMRAAADTALRAQRRWSRIIADLATLQIVCLFVYYILFCTGRVEHMSHREQIKN